MRDPRICAQNAVQNNPRAPVPVRDWFAYPTIRLLRSCGKNTCNIQNILLKQLASTRSVT